MKHTNRRSLPWLHISLRDALLSAPPREFLFGDFDGEVFEEVLTGRVPANDLPYLRRADHVGLVVDGASVADLTQRDAELQQLMYLVRELLTGHALVGPRALSLLITKFDVVEELNAVERGRIEAWMENLNVAVNEVAGVEVPLLRLAVRSESAKFPLGHGLETFLEVLALRPALHVVHQAPAFVPTSALGRFRHD